MITDTVRTDVWLHSEYRRVVTDTLSTVVTGTLSTDVGLQTRYRRVAMYTVKTCGSGHSMDVWL